MVYETSYGGGHQPFHPDTKRGYWSNPNDFIYAGVSLAFRFDLMLGTWLFTSYFSEFSIIPTYIICLALYIVPFMIIQSFMGQFSSSGFISAFRLSPLFKGIGYVTLAVNICVLTYYSIFAMIPLLYMFASMQPTLPWSCEGFKKWSLNLTEDEQINLCNIHYENATDDADNSTETYSEFVNHHIPSVLYLKTMFHDPNLFTSDDLEYSMSWQLILCALLVWALAAVIIYKFFNTEKFGQLIRYSVWTLIGLLILFIVRFSFLAGAGKVYRQLFFPKWSSFLYSIEAMPMYVFSAFGPGWGLFITLSSFNKFKTNIVKSSYLIGFGHLFILIALNILSHLSEVYLNEILNDNYYSEVDHVWTLYLSSASVMSHMGWPNLWSIMFYLMLFIASMLMIIIQVYSILTTIFDEFVPLRESKFEVSMGLIGVMAVFSLYFTSNHGLTYFSNLSWDTTITHTLNNLVLILIVLWIYGRVRFQRDLEFMINVRFSTWKINILRFVAPVFMLLTLIGNIIIAFFEHQNSNSLMAVYAILFIVLPWLCIPAYAVRSIMQSMGSLKLRFQRCCRPTDWYPVESEHRQAYEEAMGTVDITHQLNEMTDEVM